VKAAEHVVTLLVDRHVFAVSIGMRMASVVPIILSTVLHVIDVMSIVFAVSILIVIKSPVVVNAIDVMTTVSAATGIPTAVTEESVKNAEGAKEEIRIAQEVRAVVVINLDPEVPARLAPVLSAGTAESAQCAVTVNVNRAPAVPPAVTVHFAPVAESVQDVVTAPVKTAMSRAATAKNVRTVMSATYAETANVAHVINRAVPVLSANADLVVYPLVVLPVDVAQTQIQYVPAGPNVTISIATAMSRIVKTANATKTATAAYFVTV